MEGSNCQGCVQRDQIIAALSAEVAALRAELRELKARLGLHSQNSSLPPSADPPHAPPRPPKYRSGRKRGGQPRHPGHVRQRLPAERVTHLVTHVPEICEHCQAALPPEPQPEDPPATWHQVVELPPVLAEVVEHQGQA